MADSTIQPKLQFDKNGNRLVQTSGSVRAIETGAKELLLNSPAVSALGTPSAEPGVINVFEEQIGHIRRMIITLTNVAVSTTDNGASGAQGTLQLATLPRGNLQYFGGTSDLAITGDGTNITATAAVVSAVGSAVPASDATLTGTEADLIPSYAATLAASAGVVKGKGITGKFFDNTTFTNATQTTANLNFAIPDAGSSANGTITVNGTIRLSYYNHGDN